jgi:hypothetical protein
MEKMKKIEEKPLLWNSRHWGIDDRVSDDQG